MKKKTLRYISLLLLLTMNSLWLCPDVWSQSVPRKKDKETLKAEYQSAPFYQGSSIGVEVAGVAGYALGGDILSSEIKLEANFKNRYMPVLEIGYGKTDATNDDTQMHYMTKAPYFRIGMDYNVFYLKHYLPGHLFVGGRYGISSFTYDVDGPTMTDPNYGGHLTSPYAYTGQKSSAQWLEAIVGIKVKIYRRFCMGWAVRYKIRMKVGENENSTPWYVPGYGKNGSSSFNLTYNLTYDLPF